MKSSNSGGHDAVKDALAREAANHLRTITVLSDPEFVEGGRIGLEQERRGEGIPLAEARRRAAAFCGASRRYGRCRPASAWS